MKNTFFRLSLFLLITIGFFSCDTEPLDNGLTGGQDPSEAALFSVRIGDENYSTNNTVAIIEGGILTIKAVSGKEQFILRSQGVVVGTYTGSQLDFKYTNLETSEVYSSVHPVSGLSNSELTVSSINFQEETITGIFSFTGYKISEGGENPTVTEMSFSQGVFKNISYGGEDIVDPEDPEDPEEPEDPQEACNLATSQAEAAYQSYITATSDNFVEACNAYKAALENQKEVCGDEDGAIQSIIDSLDCSEVEPSAGTISVTIGSYPLLFDQVSIDKTGSLIKTYAETSSDGTDYTIYFEVQEGQTGEDIFQNFKLTIGSIELYPHEGGGNGFINTVNVNSGGKLSGTFSGYVIDQNSVGFVLSNGIFDLEH